MPQMPMDNNMGMPQMDMGGEMPQDPSMGGYPNEQMPMDGGMGGESDFDTNFDAGVEANEDADPKKYIQQLTGKLSTELNKYISDNPDEGLCKYVGKMISKAASKGLDEKGKNELIGAINSEDDSEEKSEDMEAQDADMDMEQQPEDLQENVYTKAEVKKLQETFKQRDREELPRNEIDKNIKSPFTGKKF